jgi:hypothetical protein
MPTLKQGQKHVQFVLEEGSEVHLTLLEWAKHRGLTPGKATRVILADWADALNGRPNPFAAAIAAAAGIPVTAGSGQIMQTATLAQEPEINPEERTRQAALLEAAEQFM